MPTNSTATPGRMQSRSAGKSAGIIRGIGARPLAPRFNGTARCFHAGSRGTSGHPDLAAAERPRVGSTVRLATSADGADAREFHVAGIYEPTPDPERLGQVPREI